MAICKLEIAKTCHSDNRLKKLVWMSLNCSPGSALAYNNANAFRDSKVLQTLCLVGRYCHIFRARAFAVAGKCSWVDVHCAYLVPLKMTFFSVQNFIFVAPPQRVIKWMQYHAVY